MTLYAKKGPRVGLNAHLLSVSQTYRAAGVSRYIQSLIRHLPRVDGGLEYHAYLGRSGMSPAGWVTHRAPWSTEHPVARISWEQLALPRDARGHKLDLLHVPVYVGPLAAPCPLIVSVHDLSFFRYPELFPRVKRYYLQPLSLIHI